MLGGCCEIVGGSLRGCGAWRKWKGKGSIKAGVRGGMTGGESGWGGEGLYLTG